MYGMNISKVWIEKFSSTILTTDVRSEVLYKCDLQLCSLCENMVHVFVIIDVNMCDVNMWCAMYNGCYRLMLLSVLT